MTTQTEAPTRAQISRELAEEALAVVKAQFRGFIDAAGNGPKLYPPGFHADVWTIAWDDGPFEWAIEAFHGEFDAEAYDVYRSRGVSVREAAKRATTNQHPAPPGVFTDPVNHRCVALYPQD